MTGLRTVVLAGEGVVAQRGSAGLVVLGSPPEGLLAALDADDPVAHLRALIGASVPGTIPPLALVTPSLVILHGGIEARALGVDADESVFTSMPGGQPTEHALADFRQVAVGVGVAGTMPPGDVFDLRDGIVPGAGLVLVAPVPEPMPGEALAVAFDTIRLPGESAPSARPPLAVVGGPPVVAAPVAPTGAPVPPDAPAHEPRAPAAPLPTATDGSAGEVVVDGVYCSRNHFSHPHSRYCSSCGISLVQATTALRKGVRPPLGFIVFDDSSTYSLDTDYVLGSAPHDDPRVQSGQARPIVLADPSGTLSPVHIDVRLEGWDVAVVDRSTYYGSYVAVPNSGGWAQLHAEVPAALIPGTSVLAGRRVFTFDSPHLRRPFASP